MALSILDGNQSATTLSTILSSGQHITAHTVVSLGTQAITDIVNATSAGLTNTQLRASAVTVGGTVTVGNSLTISSLPALSAGTAQIGSVTASISNFPATQPVSLSTVPTHGVTIANTSVTVNGTFFQGTQPVSLASLPALVAGTAQIGSVTASISGTVPVSGTFFQATQPVSLSVVPTHGVTLAGTTVTVLALPRPTWTNYSGTVTTANTAITAISTTTRSYLLAQVTTGQMFLNIGATATSLNSVYFAAGQGFAWETSVPQGIVSIISSVTGTNYVLKEG